MSQNLLSVHVGQIEFEQNQVGPDKVKCLQRLPTRPDGKEIISRRSQRRGENLERCVFIVNE